MALSYVHYPQKLFPLSHFHCINYPILQHNINVIALRRPEGAMTGLYNTRTVKRFSVRFDGIFSFQFLCQIICRFIFNWDDVTTVKNVDFVSLMICFAENTPG